MLAGGRPDSKLPCDGIGRRRRKPRSKRGEIRYGMKLPRVRNLMPDWGRYWNQIPFRTRLVLLGFGLTGMVLVMQAVGLLAPLEAFLYDTRAKYCQHYSRPPTTQLVHLDIDDGSYETIGQPPWPRKIM